MSKSSFYRYAYRCINAINECDALAYKYHLSQFRIRIEMCFGRFVSKWRILKTPLCVKLRNATRIIYACTRLHNYCINEGDTGTLPPSCPSFHHLLTKVGTAVPNFFSSSPLFAKDLVKSPIDSDMFSIK